MDWNKITAITGLPFEVPDIERAVLPMHPSKSWETLEGLRQPDQINTIIIHHMASDAPLENQARYHINTHGWPGLSYHLVISEGRIKQVNNLLALTYHAASHNGHTVAIAIHSDLSKRELTSQERELLYAAILTVKNLLPITKIVGHNEVNATACPCTSMNRIREDVATIEHRMHSASTWKAKLNNIGELANQYNYMWNLIQAGEKDGNAQWAMNQLLSVREVLKERKLL